LVEKHAAKEIELLDLYQERKEDIARLNKETTEVCHERLGQAPTADQWMEREMDDKLKIFDDPSWNDDQTVTDKKAQLLAAASTFRRNWATFQSDLDFLVKHAADEKKRKYTEEAKAAAEATRKADEEAKEAKKAEDEQKRKLEEDAKASRKAEADRKKKEDEETSAAKAKEVAAATPPKDGSTRDRTRSPSNTKVFTKGSDSAASSSTHQRPKNVTEALAKRPSDRNDEETLLAASEAKASRKDKQSWADAADAMQDDSQA
jgi:colicin import membrane protein